jgi:hypothetical protein
MYREEKRCERVNYIQFAQDKVKDEFF